jgi:hypothetical protein
MLARLDDTEADTGPRGLTPGTERLCLVTRKIKPTAEMIRFVIDPDGAVVADLRRRLPGRGVWITATRAMIVEAIKRKTFRQGFQQDIKTAVNFVETVEEQLVRSALNALSIAHKAGGVAIGFSRVEAAIGDRRALALIHAAEAGAEGVRKIFQALSSRIEPDAGEIPQIRKFTSAQLDLALGRSNVVHAALLAGPASETFLSRWQFLEYFQADGPENAIALAGQTDVTQDRERNG